MNYFKQIPKNLYAQEWAFLGMGLDLRAQSDQPLIKKPIRWTILMLFNAFECIMVASFVWVNRREVAIITDGMLQSIQMFCSLTKTFVFMYKGRRLIQLINDIYEPIVEENSGISIAMTFLLIKVSHEEREVFLTLNRQGQIFAAIYGVMCILSSTSFSAMPFLDYIAEYRETGEFKPETIFSNNVPYDTTNLWIYLVDSVIGLSVLVYLTYATTSVDALFCWYIFNITGHFRILMMRLRKTIDDTLSPGAIAEWNVFQERLSKVLDYHLTILGFIDRFDAVFRDFILVEVLTSCALYCTVICQFIMPPEEQNKAFVVFYGILITWQLFIYGFGAEMLKTEVENFSTALYLLFPWHRMTNRMRLHMILPMMRAQKDIVVGGYFFVMDRALLVWIFKTAGSFSTLLKALRD